MLTRFHRRLRGFSRLLAPLALARRLADKLITLADSLAEFSERGRDAGGGMREMTIVWPYILRYRVEGDTVFILRIRHGARGEDDAQ